MTNENEVVYECVYVVGRCESSAHLHRETRRRVQEADQMFDDVSLKVNCEWQTGRDVVKGGKQGENGKNWKKSEKIMKKPKKRVKMTEIDLDVMTRSR